MKKVLDTITKILPPAVAIITTVIVAVGDMIDDSGTDAENTDKPPEQEV